MTTRPSRKPSLQQESSLASSNEVRHKLVEHYCLIGINDAKVCRTVCFIVDPCLGSQQCVRGSRSAKRPSSLDYLAGRVHLDYEQRKIGGHDLMPYPALAKHSAVFGREAVPHQEKSAKPG